MSCCPEMTSGPSGKSAFLIIAVIVVLGILLITVPAMMKRYQPTEVIVKPLTRQICYYRPALKNGDTLFVAYNSYNADQPRSQVRVGDHSKYWLRVTKDSHHLDDIKRTRYCTLALGEYQIEVIDRVTEKTVSTVFIYSEVERFPFTNAGTAKFRIGSKS